MLPERFKDDLVQHLAQAKKVFDIDWKQMQNDVDPAGALERKAEGCSITFWQRCKKARGAVDGVVIFLINEKVWGPL